MSVRGKVVDTSIEELQERLSRGENAKEVFYHLKYFNDFVVATYVGKGAKVLDGILCVLDKKCKRIICDVFLNCVYDMGDGYYWVVETFGEWNVLDKSGRLVYESGRFLMLGSKYVCGWLSCTLNDCDEDGGARFNYVNREGELLLSENVRYGTPFSEDGVAVVVNDCGCSGRRESWYIDSKGKELFKREGYRFAWCGDFKFGYGVVRLKYDDELIEDGYNDCNVVGLNGEFLFDRLYYRVKVRHRCVNGEVFFDVWWYNDDDNEFYRRVVSDRGYVGKEEVDNTIDE